MKTTYRGHEFQATRTTTDATRQVFGRTVPCIAQLWEVTGRHGKAAPRRPFLTSARACRE